MMGKRVRWRTSVWFVCRFALHVLLGGRVVVWNEGQRVLLELWETDP